MEAICHVSLEAVKANYQFFQQKVAPAQVIPVVKANAYGHGVVEVSRYLYQELGVTLFAVAILSEARDLSNAIPDISILIFSRVFANEISQLPPNAILSIGSLEDAKSLMTSKYSGIKVHINVNTGMNRLGVTPEQAIDLISDSNSALDIQGVYSHFSSSDTLSESVYHHQNKKYQAFVSHIRKIGFTGLVHLSNSAGVLHKGQNYYDAMRLGIGLYGYDTTATGSDQKYLQPAMQIKAPLIRVEQIKARQSVSYAEKWQSATDTTIGTLRIGYADGYNRALTNRGIVSYEGNTYPVIGTVTMDHIMIDLGDDQLPTGSMITVMGGAADSVKIASIAQRLDTIPYEVCCAISQRVNREHTL